MALGPNMLPNPAQNWTEQNGGGVNIAFTGGGQGRVRHTALETIVPGMVRVEINLKWTDGNDFIYVFVGGSVYYIEESTTPDVYVEEFETVASNQLIDIRADDTVAILTAQVNQVIAD